MLLRAKPFPVPFLLLVHSTHIYLPMKMEQTECSETSAYKLQTPSNYPKESIQHKEFVTIHGHMNVKNGIFPYHED